MLCSLTSHTLSVPQRRSLSVYVLHALMLSEDTQNIGLIVASTFVVKGVIQWVLMTTCNSYNQLTSKLQPLALYLSIHVPGASYIRHE